VFSLSFSLSLSVSLVLSLSLPSSKSDQDAEPEVECAIMILKEVTSLEDIKQEIEEQMVVKGQDKEREEEEDEEEVPKIEGEHEEEEEEEEEEIEEIEEIAEEADAETVKDAENQEVPGKGQQLAVGVAPYVNAPETLARKEEDSSEDGVGNRLVVIILWFLYRVNITLIYCVAIPVATRQETV